MQVIKKEQSLVQRRARLDLSRPSAEDHQQVLNETQVAIYRLIGIRSGEILPDRAPRTVEYTPQGADDAKTLTIVEKQNDPLEPPRHRYKKKPMDMEPATEETRAPILRRPPRPLTAEEKQQWEIPASVSNWKNDRGFLIDLDTRAAAGPPAPVAKQLGGGGDLASALSSAAAEVQQERDEDEAQINAQNALRARLRAQKEQSKPKNDMFDQRLFHSSKRKHDLYADSLFSRKGRSKRRIQFEK